MTLHRALLALFMRLTAGTGEVARDGVPRPTVVRVAVPYLATTWLAVWWVLGERLISTDIDFVVVMTLWTIAWGAMLYRVWRGGPVAIAVVSSLVVAIAGAMAAYAVIFPIVVAILTYLTAVVLGYPMIDGAFGLPAAPAWWVAVVGNVLAVVMGVMLRRRVVRQWCAALHPLRGGAEDDTSNAS